MMKAPTDTTAPVRLALLGCGRAAQFLHLPSLRRIEGAVVSMLTDPNPAMLASAAGGVANVRVAEDWRDAIHCSAVDAVVIGLPSHLHAIAAREALLAGKHVYVEKPVGIDISDARQLLEACSKAAPGLVAMSGFNFRFHPVYLEARRRIACGDIGDLVAISTVFAVPPRQLPPWKVDRGLGGGAMLDQFSHHADLVRFLVQDIPESSPQRIYSRIRSVRSTADTAAVLTELANGVCVSSTFTLCSAEQDRIEFHGTAGKLVADRIAGQVWFEQAGGGYTRIDRIDRMISNTIRAGKLSGFVLNPSGQTGHEAALREFVAAIEQNRPPTVTIQDGLESLAWVLAAERSADEGSWVGLDRESLGLKADVRPDDSRPDDNRLQDNQIAEFDEDIRPDLKFPHLSEMPAIKFPADRPLATVVLVASNVDDSVINVVRHVRQQTIADRIEFIVVTATESESIRAVALPESETERLGEIRTIGLGRPVHDVDAEAAGGVSLARGPVTCIVEDHAFPTSDWVERLVNVYRQGPTVGAAGSCVLNANPDSALSRMNILIAYGAFMQPLDLQTDTPSNHNVSYRTDALTCYGDTLARRMSRTGTIMDDLYRRGFATKIIPTAVVHHANPSRLLSSIGLRFDSGRLQAAKRADVECWPTWKRWMFCLLSPGIAPVLYARSSEKRKHHRYRWQTLPALATGLLCDALGQGTGFVAGTGRAADRCREFELGRLRHLRGRDRVQLSDRRLAFSQPDSITAPEGTGSGTADLSADVLDDHSAGDHTPTVAAVDDRSPVADAAESR